MLAHAELLQRDVWIIDGFGCVKSAWERFARADTLVYVDLPLFTHFLWITKRLLKGLVATPEGWPQGSPMLSSTINSYRVLWQCHRHLTPRYRQLVSEARQDKRVYHLRSAGEMSTFLNGVRREAPWLLLSALALAATAGAGPVIETKSLRYTLPDGWVADLGSRPISAKGPRGELLQVTVSSLSGQGSAQDARSIVRSVERRALAAIRAAEKESGFRTTKPLTSEQLPNGSSFHQLVSTSSDGKKVLAQFVVVSPRAVILATLDLPSAATSSVETIGESLRNIQWAP